MNASELDSGSLHRGSHTSRAIDDATGEGRWIDVAIADTAERAEVLLMLHIESLRQSIMTTVPLEIGIGGSAT